MTTLANYLNDHAANPALNDVITTVTDVGKTISQLLRKGALADILGKRVIRTFKAKIRKNWTYWLMTCY